MLAFVIADSFSSRTKYKLRCPLRGNRRYFWIMQRPETGDIWGHGGRGREMGFTGADR